MFHEISIDKQKAITEYFDISFRFMNYKRKMFFLKILCDIFEIKISKVPLKLVGNLAVCDIFS